MPLPGTKAHPHSPRAVVILLIVYALIVFPLLDRIRYVMGDEAAYLDPAINLALGEGFRSYAWGQSSDEFWASNVPLHAIVAAAWFQGFGPTLYAGRALSLFFFLAGILLSERALARLAVFQSSAQSCAYAAVLLCGVYSCSIGQFARPDALCFLILAAATFALSLKHGMPRASAFFLLGCAATLAGFQLVVVMAWLWFLGIIFFGAQAFKLGLASGAGCLTGLGLLYILYASMGVLDIFRDTLSAPANRAQWHGLRDPTIWASALGLLLILRKVRLSEKQRKIGFFTCVAGATTPFILLGLAKFPQYYSFFAVAPLAVGLGALASIAWEQWRGPLRLFGVCLIGGPLALGFPLLLLMVWNQWEQRDPKLIEKYCENIQPEDVVYCDPTLYFAVKPKAKTTYTQFYLNHASTAQKESINVLALNPLAGHPYLTKETIFQQLLKNWQLVETRNAMDLPNRSALISKISKLSYMRPPAVAVWRSP